MLHISLVGSLAGMIVSVAAWGFSILVMTEAMKEIPQGAGGVGEAGRRG
ncbi:hypothetical protein [Streptomyces viridosporus]|nr:hypothetical protein [Streptomyces viridosporus]